MSRASLDRQIHLKRVTLAALESQQDEIEDHKKRVKAEIADLERAQEDFAVELRSDYEMGEAA